MVYERARAYAIEHVGQIIPLDKDTCEDIINYTLSLSDSDIESHLLDLLGASDETFKLISTFMDLKRSEDEFKKLQEEKKAIKRVSNASPGSNAGPKPLKTNKIGGSAWGSGQKSVTPAPKHRLASNKGSVTTSQLSEIKPSNKLSNTQAKKSKKKNLEGLADIEAVLINLEVENAQNSVDLDSISSIRRVCNCMAARHPLFEVAPNCLNCGKIICSKEGLQPCSSCGNELLSEFEKQDIIKILRSEKDLLESKSANPSNKAVQNQPSKLTPKKIKYGTTPGGNLWKAQDEALRIIEKNARKQREFEAEQAKKAKELEEQAQELEHYRATKYVNADLAKAQERLETLLHFQETGAERSKIIDNASDFEMPGVSSGSMWLSPVERALQLKKQQKQLRKIQSEEKSRSGRTKKVVEMVIRDGKVTMVEKSVIEDDKGTDEEDIGVLEKIIKEDKLDHEASLAKNVWDPKKELDKWERPVYVMVEGARKDDGTFNAHMRERVQQEKIDSAELVAAMYS